MRFEAITLADESLYPAAMSSSLLKIVGNFAHCKGHNANSIGVCYVGGLSKDGKTSKDTRTPLQKLAIKCLLMRLKAKYPDAVIKGHRDFAAKDCPCFDAAKEYANI